MFGYTHRFVGRIGRLVVALCIVGTLAAVVASTAGAVTYVGQGPSSSTGTWVPDLLAPPPLGCTGGAYGASRELVSITGARVSPASGYSRYTQTITMHSVLWASKDGSNYIIPSGGISQTQSQTTVGTAPWVTFANQNWGVSALVGAGYHDFLAYEVFDWYVGPTWVGDLVVGFNSSSDLAVYFGAGAMLYKNTMFGCVI